MTKPITLGHVQQCTCEVRANRERERERESERRTERGKEMIKSKKTLL